MDEPERGLAGGVQVRQRSGGSTARASATTGNAKSTCALRRGRAGACCPAPCSKSSRPRCCESLPTSEVGLSSARPRTCAATRPIAGAGSSKLE
eukprot:3818449-Rhodomonas_salina.2